MWAKRERQNFRSPLKPFSVIPDPRSVPRFTTTRSHSAPAPANFFHTRSPLRFRSPGFYPLPSSSDPFQYVSSSKLKKWTDFYGASSYDSAVLAVVNSWFCLSVCHTRALWQNQRMHCGYFDTTWNGNHSSFLTPTVVGGRQRRPSVSNLRSKLLDPLKRADFDRFLLITSQP